MLIRKWKKWKWTNDGNNTSNTVSDYISGSAFVCFHACFCFFDLFSGNKKEKQTYLEKCTFPSSQTPLTTANNQRRSAIIHVDCFTHWQGSSCQASLTSMSWGKLNHTVAILKQKKCQIEEEGLAYCLPRVLYALGLKIFSLAGWIVNCLVYAHHLRRIVGGYNTSQHMASSNTLKPAKPS